MKRSPRLQGESGVSFLIFQLQAAVTYNSFTDKQQQLFT